MKNRTYVAKSYITVSEEEVLDYAIDLKGCKDKDEFFEKGYVITEEDWKDYADGEFSYGDYGYDELEFFEETEE